MKTITKVRPFRKANISLLFLITLLLAACSQEVKPALEPSSTLAPLLNENDPNRIPDSYIVVLKPGAKARAEVASFQGLQRASVHHTYDMEGFQGFSIKAPEQALAGLRRNPNVAYIEADAKLSPSQEATSVWGLDRIDQRDLPLNGTYSSGGKTGAGVRAYVIDSGIRASHTEFQGRVVQGYTAINDGRGTRDCLGHGTHVAGTIGGKTYGVAKQVTLVPVRVVDCDGFASLEGVLAGVDWVSSKATLPAVANMSLNASEPIQSLKDAINASIAKGITYVVSAGNDNQDACYFAPADVKAAIVVAATDDSDTRAYFSNYGPCIDLFAPGVGIASAWHTGNSATATLDGTSMAAPHVAGVVALLGAPRNAADIIKQCSSKDRVQDALSTNNHLLFSSCTTTATYTVNFTSSTVPVGRVITSVSLGRGVYSSTGTITSNVGVYAKRSGLSGNMAMVTGTAKHLIISKDGKSQTSYAKGGYISFKFSNFGSGTVGVKTLKVKNTTTTGGTIKVYRGTTLLKSVSVPKTGLGASTTLNLNVSNASLVKVALTGPGAVDNVAFQAPQ